MPSGQKPVAELVRNVHGVPVLYLYHLTDENLRRIHDIMLINSDSRVHYVRAVAKAHLGEYDTCEGRASIFLYGEDTEFYQQFNAMLSGELGIIFPNAPVDDHRRTG